MAIINFNSDYSYDAIINYADILVSRYTSILKYICYGYSYDNRKLFLLKLGKGPCKLICTAGVHGREWINTPVLMKIIETYCELYSEKYNIFSKKLRYLLDKYSIVFIPLVNPDGYEIATKGFDIIKSPVLRNICKNTGLEYKDWKFNARVTDINRNFESVNRRKIINGKKAFSELETIGLKKVFDKFRADIYLDFHSRGKCIYYYRNAKGNLYNIKQYNIAKKIARITKYSIMQPRTEIPVNDTGGNTVHYYSEFLDKYAITIETVDDREEFPLKHELVEETYNEVVSIPYSILHEICIV